MCISWWGQPNVVLWIKRFNLFIGELTHNWAHQVSSTTLKYSQHYTESIHFFFPCVKLCTPCIITHNEDVHSPLCLWVCMVQVSVCSTHNKLLQHRQYRNVHSANIITFCWSLNAKWQLLYYKRAKGCNQSTIFLYPQSPYINSIKRLSILYGIRCSALRLVIVLFTLLFSLALLFLPFT